MAISVPIKVLLDANILYSRIIRDYFLYSAIDGIISVFWSEAILQESLDNMIKKVPSFTSDHAMVLKQRLESGFPYATVEPTRYGEFIARNLDLPDPGDAHVVAAAISCEASILCTNNLRDFPTDTLAGLNIIPMSADNLLSTLITNHQEAVFRVHNVIANRNPATTHESTLHALQQAGARHSAKLLEELFTNE